MSRKWQSRKEELSTPSHVPEMAVKEGGVIIAANEQNDGVGSDEFEQIITTEADILAPTRTLLGTSVHFL